ncbi:hypothetical protein GCM10022223_37860 [Kineosporia mesophila]|uniref:Uncharacterized protein n=1 Tax=Kineosporia mesophila TaxID=566012 RepID=A0ABP6ZR42_9ACTN|nr:hypothetical protein [Kineosporia mesophila]MCD5349791.1 hypothetical protein [Kineosporia mesophila]
MPLKTPEPRPTPDQAKRFLVERRGPAVLVLPVEDGRYLVQISRAGLSEGIDPIRIARLIPQATDVAWASSPQADVTFYITFKEPCESTSRVAAATRLPSVAPRRPEGPSRRIQHRLRGQ